MNLRTVSWLVGFVLLAVALAQAIALLVALALGEPWRPFTNTIGAGAAVAMLLLLPARRGEHSLDHRSAFLAVSLAWAAACILGAGPFFHHPALGLSAIDALFESVSGFTTTGATVVSGLDQLPRSLLLWRSLCQWLGGMGIVLLGIAVFPVLGLGGMQLFKAEAPGPTKDKITPRIAETAKLLWVLYLGLTVADGVLLWIGGMTPFDAICHAMATISTGGFSTHDASLGYYESGFIHLVTSAFMLLGGMSFAVLHRALTRGIKWSESPELRAYLGIFALASLLIAIDLRVSMPETYGTAAEALEPAIFQAATILTTTGFTTQNFDLWPPLSHAVILGLFFVGGMAGSTGGGLKVIRILVIARLAFSQFFRLVHPHGFSAIKLGVRTLEDQVVLSVLGFFGMWILLLIVGTGLICGFGSDLLTGFSAAAVTLGNIGPGFGGVGPAHTYEGFAQSAKLVMAGLMLMGRLEIYAALIILTPGFWRRW
jgi:trk system potassium uptake protein TrkH